MLIRNLRRPGDYARAVIAQKDQLRLEIANDNRIAKIRQNQKFGIVETPEQEKDLAERIGDANQRRQTAFDNLSQIFTAEQVDRFMPLLDDSTYQFLNLYWKDMKAELTKKANTKQMDEFFFKNYLNRYIGTIMDQKGLSTPVGTQSSVNEIEELESLFEWRDEAKKSLDRMSKVDTPAAKELVYLLNLVPDKRRIERIRSLSDKEKQRTVEALSDAFRGVETDPNEWKKATQQSSNQSFYSATVPLYRNMTEAQKQSAKEMVDYMNDPLSFAKSQLEDEPEPAPTGTPAEEPEPKPKSKAKKGLIVATAVEGEAKGDVADARPIDQRDYMSPADFDREEVGVVGKQMRYITLLKQTDALPEQLKTQIFYNRDIGKPNPISFYSKPKEEGVANRQSLYARLITYDKQIKSAFELKEKEGKGMKRKPGRPKSGKGIASTCKEQTPRWIELGRYRINGRLLDEKQLLSVRYQSGTAVPVFKKMIPISDAFHELLTTLISTKKLDKRLLKELDPEEQRSAEVLLVKSGVGRSFGIKEITPTDEEQKKIKRFEVVKGSYLAGNNAPAVIHELRSLIIYFVETGHLSRKEGLRSLMELQ